MQTGSANIAIQYDESSYLERLERAARVSAGSPIGLMGRQVAGKAFLEAYLHYGNWTKLVALVRSRSAGESLVRFCREHPSSRRKKRRLQVVEERDFHETFFPSPPATLQRAREIAVSEGLQHVYLGNLIQADGENTNCPGCGSQLIKRHGYTILENRLRSGKCPTCQTEIRGIWN